MESRHLRFSRPDYPLAIHLTSIGRSRPVALTFPGCIAQIEPQSTAVPEDVAPEQFRDEAVLAFGERVFGRYMEAGK